MPKTKIDKGEVFGKWFKWFFLSFIIYLIVLTVWVITIAIIAYYFGDTHRSIGYIIKDGMNWLVPWRPITSYLV